MLEKDKGKNHKQDNLCKGPSESLLETLCEDRACHYIETLWWSIMKNYTKNDHLSVKDRNLKSYDCECHHTPLILMTRICFIHLMTGN